MDEPRHLVPVEAVVGSAMNCARAIREEISIYENLLAQRSIEATNVSPLALAAAATLAVLTRRSGDDGVLELSPREVVDEVSLVAIRGSDCLGGATLIDTLSQSLRERSSVPEAERNSLDALLALARAHYDEMVWRTIWDAMVTDFVPMDVIQREVLGELQSQPRSAHNGAFPTLWKLEASLEVRDSGPDNVRRKVLEALPAAGALDGGGAARDDRRVDEALERVLLASWHVLLASWPDAPRAMVARGSDNVRRLKKRLVQEFGFPDGCADDLIVYARALIDEPRSVRRLFPDPGVACSGGALLLTALVWSGFAAGVQPLYAAAVLTFLGAGPVLLVARFARTLGPAGAAAIGAACAAIAAAFTAFAMLLAGVWAPKTGVLALSALVGAAALLDLLWAWRRRLRAET